MCAGKSRYRFCFFFQAEDGIRVADVTGVQTCALPISTGPAAAGVVAGLQLRPPQGRAPAGGRVGRYELAGGADHRDARVAALAELRLPADLRRARRLLRACRAAATRRLRAQYPGAAVGDLALRQDGTGALQPSCRAQLDPEADRGSTWPTHAQLAEPP